MIAECGRRFQREGPKAEKDIDKYLDLEVSRLHGESMMYPIMPP